MLDESWSTSRKKNLSATSFKETSGYYKPFPIDNLTH